MAKKVTVEYKCDAEFCSQKVEPLVSYWTPVVATQSANSLVFFAWTDERASVKDALHFHDDACANTYLTNWLEKQKPKAVPSPAEEYKGDIPAITTIAGGAQ